MRSSSIARAAALLLLLCAVLWSARANAEEFDKTLSASKGSRLDVRLYGGTIAVRAWARDDVRVRATHFRTDEIAVRSAGGTITVRARSRVGQPHAIDLSIDVPGWMAVALAGTYIDVTVEGTRADVSAATVRGDVKVKGGAGAITLKSIEGEVVLEDAEGRADLTSVSNGVRVARVSGDLIVRTVNGSVKLDALRASSVSVGTMGGDVAWQGAMSGQGRYEFATHDGDIDVNVPRDDNATVSVRLFDGRFQASFPVAVPPTRDRRKPFTFALGSGTARVSLETFRGTISMRQAAARTATASEAATKPR